LAIPSSAAADVGDANALLAKGPLVLVERGSDGKFQKCTALALVKAPIEKVWQVITDFGSFQTLVPKVVKSEVIRQTDNVVDVKLEIDVPGSNTKYVMRHTLHPETHTIEANWLEGDLKGSAWVFHLESTSDGSTLLSYSGVSRHFSRVLESFEDDQQTITMGVNVSSALTMVNAVKKRIEGK
jgi:ribosome-associated toxin RatA of RatAB toxin-antitoxin module